MRLAFVPLAAIALGTLNGAAGCNHCCKNQPRVAAPPPGAFVAPPGTFGPPSRPAGDLLLPSPIPPTSPPPPPGGTAFPPGGAVLPPAGANPFPPAGSSRFGAAPGLSFGTPIATPYAPSGPGSPALSVPAPGAGAQFGAPQVRAQDSSPLPSAGALPAGIPGFSRISERVAAGQKPFPDGYEWLRSQGYRTLLFIRAPGADDSDERRQADQRGLAYRTLELSPATLNERVVADFTRAVSDPSGQPLFVFDADGTLTGALWFIYFRSVERLGPDEARLRAGRLGLREDGGDEQTALWLAVQKYLSERQVQ